jgi:hypothetical protein
VCDWMRDGESSFIARVRVEMDVVITVYLVRIGYHPCRERFGDSFLVQMIIVV